MTRLAAVAFVVLAACSGAGRSATEGASSPPQRAAMSAPVTLSYGAARVVVVAEVAKASGEQRRGLMGRADVPVGTGMLFVWDDERPRTFWMKDTLVPLDLLVIRDRVVVAVLPLEPCRADPCPRTPTPSADAALEVPRGSLSEAGIGVDAQVESPALP